MAKPQSVTMEDKSSVEQELKKQHKDLEILEYEEPSKEQILQELKEAVIELKQVEQGKLKARPIQELLNEL